MKDNKKDNKLSNLSKLKTNSMANFTNDTSSVKKTKNLNIKSDEALINEYKVISFQYYKDIQKIKYFSFRHFMVLVILNMEKHFEELYGKILIPDDDYISFYKKRGTKANIGRSDVALDSINFLLPIKYSDMYFNLMHTYYINEHEDLPSYSISLFFEYVVQFAKKEKIMFFEVHL